MIRFLLTVAVQLVASAIGLIVAAWILEDMSLSGAAFLVSVAVFTVTTAVVQPFTMKMAVKHAQALLGATALATTFIGLLVTKLLTDGLSIREFETWLLATLIVWFAALMATFVAPILLAKWGLTQLREAKRN